jgi:Transglutaminase-like superfamily
MTGLRRCARLSWAEWRLLADAGVLLVAVRAALWALPWNRAIGLVRSVRISSPARLGGSSPSIDRLEWAVRNASRLVPYASCLTQALALHRLLCRAGYSSSLQIGIAKKPGRPLSSHAWVEHEGHPLVDNAGELAHYSRLLRIDTFR